MAAKFSMVNTSGLFDSAAHVEAADRLQGAMAELRVKHDRQDRAAAAAEAQRTEATRTQQQRLARSRAAAAANAAASDDTFIRAKSHKGDSPEVEEDEEDQDNYDDDDDDDEAFLAELDADPELERLRAARLAQLQSEFAQRQALLAKGHGEYREIVQDEFLREVTSSPLVLVHFYHRDFERCKIMDMHLGRLARTHIECKFLKLNAEKAPFFVEKLQIRVLPTVVGFKDGIAFPERVIGFDGLTADDEEEEEDEGFGSRSASRAKSTDSFPTIALARKLEKIGVIQHNDVDEDKEQS